MAETSSYVPWAYEERTGPIDNTTKPQRHLPWSHLTKEEFVQCKKTYTKYWYENLSTHNFARVFGELTYRVNYETGACFPSRASIAKRLRISEKTVQRAIKALEDHGLIQVRRTRDLIRSEDGFLTKGVGRSNVYTIRFDKTLYRDENDLPIIDFDEYLECLTLCGRRRLPARHLWYNCEDIDDDAKLPLLTPPCPAIDAEVPAVDPLEGQVLGRSVVTCGRPCGGSAGSCGGWARLRRGVGLGCGTAMLPIGYHEAFSARWDIALRNALRGADLRKRWVGPVGLEPTTYGLKVRCSTN
jgi:Helix-turn-helix domain